MRKIPVAYALCRNTPKPSIAFCILSTRHYLEKLGETFHALEVGSKGERGQLLTPTVSAWGQRLPFPSLSRGCSLEGVEIPVQGIPSRRAPSKLPQYLVISGCTLSCRTDSSSRCRGPRRWRCSPPQAPSSSSPPCTACSSAGPNSSSCPPGLPSPDSPCSPWPALLGGGGGGGRGGNSLIFREVNSLPRRRLVAPSLVLEQGSPGSAGPRAQPCHLCRSSSTPGKLTPQAVFAFTCLMCKHAWRGRFQSQPQTAAIHGLFPCFRVCSSPRCEAVGAGTPKWSRILPALPGPPLPRASRETLERGRASPCFHRTPSLSALLGQQGSRGQGKREGQASHPLDPRSFTFPRASAQLAAWSGPQLLTYRIASARLLTPPRGVAFRLETPDLQV